MKPLRSSVRRIIGLLCCWLIIGMAAAGNAPPETPENRTAESWRQLESLVTALETTRQNLRDLRQELRAAEGRSDRERLQRQIEQRSLELESLETALEMFATENVDLSLFGARTETEFDWRKELQSVFEPILLELRRLTERPRKLERLRSEQVYYRERLDATEAALGNIVSNREHAPSEQLKEAFASLEERWRQREQEIGNRLDVIELELQQTLSPAQGRPDPADRLKSLLTGRVLNLILAVLIMVVVYLTMRALSRLYDRHVMKRTVHRGVFAARVGNLLFYLFTTIVVLFSGMAVFYIRGDWLLLGLMLILLAGAALAAQRSLPRFLTEARLMLNLGPVREGERLIFDGIPWRVRTLGMYATLENPLLQGGILSIPLRVLVDYQSRRYEADEPWFPARIGDYLILADDTFGKVVRQTPEQVRLLVLGGVKTYPARDFLGQSPRNLSGGFTIIAEFGLDYRHQAEITSTILDVMQRDVAAGIAASEAGNHLVQFNVDFAKADESSLNLALIAEFSGAAAERYYRIRRLLQRLAVDACNRHGWVIPFRQLTVHTDTGAGT